MTPDEIIHALSEKGPKYAAARAQREYMEHFRHVKLSLLMSGEGPLAAQERDARAHVEYRSFLKGLCAKREEELLLEHECEVLRLQFEKYRTDSANARAVKA